MTQPGSIGSMIPNSGLDDSINRRFRDLDRRIASLESTALGTNGIVVNGPPGISVTGGAGIVVHDDGSIQSSDFDGTGPADPGTTGWWLGGAGDGAVFAQAAFRDGIIGDDALANPASFGAKGQAAGNFAVTTAGAYVVSQTLTVPAGFSQALVFAAAHVSAVEANGSDDYLWVTCHIDGTGSSDVISFALANQPAHASNSAVRLLTGLSGGTITIAGRARSQGANWAAQPSNSATVNAVAIFLR